MGVGRVEFQDLVRINMALDDGSFASNSVLQAAFSSAAQNSGRFHLLGLVSDGGVHSHINHLEAILRAAKEAAVPNTYVHFFADGRDTPPTSGTKYIRRLLDFTQQQQYGKVDGSCGWAHLTPSLSSPLAAALNPSAHSLRCSACVLCCDSSPQWSVATSRWTATSAGTASAWRTKCYSQARESACRPLS